VNTCLTIEAPSQARSSCTAAGWIVLTP
jgi:hypothetical protein